MAFCAKHKTFDGCADLAAFDRRRREGVRYVETLIPSKIGQKIEFETDNGLKWYVRRKPQGEFLLAPSGVISPERSRWGTKTEILNDLRFLAEHGHLPPASGQRW